MLNFLACGEIYSISSIIGFYKNIDFCNMKKIIPTLCLIVALLNIEFTKAQKTTTKSNPIARSQATTKKDAVKIVNTGKRSVVVMANFITPTITASLLKQMSAKQFYDFKMYCNEEDYPFCIKEKIAYDPAKPDEDISGTVLKSLKLYRIATFKNIRNKNDFGEYSVLVAPAKKNKNVGGDCTYEIDFYIIIPTADIEILKKS